MAVVVEPSLHYCSDRALLDMIESPYIDEDDKPAMIAELAKRLMWQHAPHLCGGLALITDS